MTTVRTQSGLAALEGMFRAADEASRPAFLPYFPVGYPDYESSLEAITAMADAGVDGFEIGVPFSDPLADGPTIQMATQVALENGVTVRRCLDAVRTLRERGVQQPMLLMSYANPLVAYGVDRLVADAKAAGADGLIVPDLPPEEAGLFAGVCAREGLAQIFLLAPTSSTERIALVAEKAAGFIYVVSLTGITGARAELPPDLQAFIARVRAQTGQRLVLGFGISRPEHVRGIREMVDGFIVGSALVRAAGEGTARVRELTAALRAALD